jgi:hypothetical protein
MPCASSTDHGKALMNTPFSPPASTAEPGNRHDRRAAAVRSREPRPEPLPHAFDYTIGDACRMTGVGRTKLYSMISKGKLQVSRFRPPSCWATVCAPCSPRTPPDPEEKSPQCGPRERRVRKLREQQSKVGNSAASTELPVLRCCRTGTRSPGYSPSHNNGQRSLSSPTASMRC